MMTKSKIFFLYLVVDHLLSNIYKDQVFSGNWDQRTYDGYPTFPFENCPLNIIRPLCISTMERHAYVDPGPMPKPKPCIETAHSHSGWEDYSHDDHPIMVPLKIPLKCKPIALPKFETDVTLTTHLTLDRLDMLDRICKHWTGPISAALFVDGTVENALLEITDYYFNTWIDELIGLLHSHPHLKITLVSTKDQQQQPLYPVNLLRGIAINQSSTTHVFGLDVDFVPNYQAYTEIKKLLMSFKFRRRQNTQTRLRAAIIIPAFMVRDGVIPYPDTKHRLIQYLEAENVTPFKMDGRAAFPKGHNLTDFSRFKVTNGPYYKVDYEKLSEPYVVVARDEAPLPDPRFVGYHRNKIEYIHALHIAGFGFYVAPQCFVIHYPHTPSSVRTSLDEYKECNEKLWLDVLRKGMKTQYAEWKKREKEEEKRKRNRD